MTQQQNLMLFSNHHLYYVIARENLGQGAKRDEEIQANEIRYTEIEELIVRATGRPDPEVAGEATSRRVALLEQRCQSLTQACVFAAMAVEAFINFYPRSKSQPNTILSAVDSLSLESKWLVTPALINNGNRLEPGQQPMQDLHYLVATRNRLVHSQPKVAVSIKDGEFNTPQEIIDNYYGLSVDEATRCVETVRRLVLALHAIDPTVETGWMDENRFRAFFIIP